MGTRFQAAAAIAAALGLLLWTVARGYEGYDLDYALIWGGQLAHGHVPAFSGHYAPTPHPLANAVAAMLTPLGRAAAADAFIVIVELSMAAVVVATWSIGRALLGRWAGILAAVVVATRPVLLGSGVRGSIDIPALALTLGALAVLLRERRAWVLALSLLAAAGLLRPEAWLLSIGVGLWRLAGEGDRRAIAVPTIALTLAPVVLWALTDLVLTGDALFSLSGTRELADELGRPRTATLAPLLVPSLLATVVSLPVLLAGTVGLAVYADRQPPGFAIVVVGCGLSMLSFVVIGAAGLPLLARYLFPAAVLLTVLGCGAALRGAPMQRSSGANAAAAAAAIALLSAMPGTVRGVRTTIGDAHDRRAVQADLRKLVARPQFERMRRTCPPLSVAGYRLVPRLAYAAGLAPQRIAVDQLGGVLVLPRSGRAAAALSSAADATPPVLRPPPGFMLDHDLQSRDWAIAASCGPEASP